jgi:hypothetical protein
MRAIILTIAILFIGFILYGCDTTDSNGIEEQLPPSNDDQTTTTYTLSVALSDDEAGNVTPGSGTFEPGEQVTIEASINQGWDFGEWSGDLQSTDNPFTFTINSDINLTANFLDRRSEYSVLLTLSDIQDELQLEFGQDEQDSFEYAPPSPPAGALHGYLSRAGEDYFIDYQQDILREVNWELHLQAGSGNTVKLNWHIEEIKMNGNLILKDPDETFQLDMIENSEFEYIEGSYNHLVIEYEIDD